MDTITVRVQAVDEALAAEIRALYEQEGGQVTSSPKKGIVPIIPIVIAAVIGLAGLATVVLHIIKGRGCQVILDFRSAELQKEVDCSIRDGRIIIITRDNERVQIVETGDLVDITAVIEAGLGGGAADVKDAALAAGAKVVA